MPPVAAHQGLVLLATRIRIRPPKSLYLAPIENHVANLIMTSSAAVGPSPIRAVLLAHRSMAHPSGHRALSHSLPGHLIQLMVEGRAQHVISGRRYLMEPGHLVWYHEDEQVEVEVVEGPWSFYSLNFVAPTLSPPPFEERVQTVGAPVLRRFDRLVAAWSGDSVASRLRQLRVHAALNDLLAAIPTGNGQPFEVHPEAALWWELETRFRQDLAQPMDLQILAVMAKRSVATISRAARRATGKAPMQRLKQVRMSYASSLVRRSELAIGEIAARVGYGRVHEFSRDYRKHFGCPPTADRQ